MAAAGKLKIDIQSYIDYVRISAVTTPAFVATWKSFVGKTYKNRLRIAGAKLGLDGSIQL